MRILIKKNIYAYIECNTIADSIINIVTENHIISIFKEIRRKNLIFSF